MKKSIAATLTLSLALACAVPLSACNTQEDYTRMTVDINPSVEFILDSDEKVVSVTALNDDGALIVAGEAFVGKDAEEAAQLVVSLATETGYLIRGEATASENQITITLSGDEEAARKLYEDIDAALTEFLQTHNVTAAVQRAEAMQLSALRTLVAACRPELTEEELAAMNEQQLVNELKLSRVETALLLTESMRELYYEMKEYEIDLSQRETTKRLIDSADAVYQSFKDSYDAMLTEYENVISRIEQTRYDYLISPDSDYQRALQALLDAKAALLEQKNKIAALDDGPEKIAAQAILQIRQTAYDAAYASCTMYGSSANAAIDLTVAALQTVKTQLENLEKSFPEEIKTELTRQTEAFDEAANSAKDSAFASFEARYGTDIQSITERLAARKEALIQANA